jgi:hypothetical protein
MQPAKAAAAFNRRIGGIAQIVEIVLAQWLDDMLNGQIRYFFTDSLIVHNTPFTVSSVRTRR